LSLVVKYTIYILACTYLSSIIIHKSVVPSFQFSVEGGKGFDRPEWVKIKQLVLLANSNYLLTFFMVVNDPNDSSLLILCQFRYLFFFLKLLSKYN